MLLKFVFYIYIGFTLKNSFHFLPKFSGTPFGLIAS